MHLYNAWLPPPVAAQTAGERDSFARVIAAVKSAFRSDDPDSVFSTLKFISVLDLSVSTSQFFNRCGFLFPNSSFNFFVCFCFRCVSSPTLNFGGFWNIVSVDFRFFFYFWQVLWCEVLENDVEFVIEGCEVLLEVTESLRSVRFMVL